MKLLTIIALLISLNTFAQTNAPVTASATTAANMCTERGLKCCNKARGKRAEKIRSKCEKKYKCICPAPSTVAAQ